MAPVAAVLLGASVGVVAVSRDLSLSSGTPCAMWAADASVTAAQAMGGLGVVLPPAYGTSVTVPASADPPPSQGQGPPPPLRELQQDPSALLGVMQMVREDPNLMAEALDRVRRSGMGGDMTDDTLRQVLDSLLADPERLQGILGEIGGSPGLLQGMLSQMGMHDLSEEQLRVLMGRLGQNPDLLGALARGDPAAIDALAEQLAAPTARGQLDLGGIQDGVGHGDVGQLDGLGEAGGLPTLGTELLGTGASLSLLADMLAGFGGADTTELEQVLRAGDLTGLFELFGRFYGPTGALSADPSLGGGTISSYTDLLDALLGME